uniref:Uncharacterized protein n=1 Tax=Rhizophora mucronata TaxID=61149 RepID=A0A2P2QYR6_RHIMU
MLKWGPRAKFMSIKIELHEHVLHAANHFIFLLLLG